MFEFFLKLFALDFMPHVYCLRLPEVIWLHVIADGLIAVAYTLIPIALILLIRKRRDMDYSWMIGLFGIFILACGTTHFLNIVTLWYPIYRLDGVLKAVTAIASVLTAISLFRLLPIAVALPSPERLRREVMERMKAEDELRNLNATLERRVDQRTLDLAYSNARFQAAVQAVGDVIWTNSPDGEMSGEQPAWAALTGQTVKDYVGHGWASAVHPDDAQPTIQAWHQAVATRSPFVFEHRVRRYDGVWRLFAVRAVPVIDDDGSVREWVGVHRDITEVRQREIDLQDARLAAEAASRAKSTFLANMSHELRTPLNAIIGYSEMLAEQAHEDEKSTHVPELHTISAAGKHLLALIDSVLDLSKIEAGKMEVHNETIPVRELIDEVIAVIEPLADRNGNRILLDIDPALVAMHADPMKLRQSLLNLLSNACKFTRQGTVTLAARVNEDGEAIFRISDTGIGLTADQLARIFEPFMQADSSTTRVYGGTGLGLSLSRRFAEMMGGSIHGESEPNQGASFTLRLPLNANAC